MRPHSNNEGQKHHSVGRKKISHHGRHSNAHLQSLGSLAEIPDIPEKKCEKINLVKFRWSLPPFGKTILKLHFKSQDLGVFEYIFNFEIVGTRKVYQLLCKGICNAPQICWEPKVVFPKVRNTVRENEIIHRCFVEDDKMYHFGPLHCGKTRER